MYGGIKSFTVVPVLVILMMSMFFGGESSFRSYILQKGLIVLIPYGFTTSAKIVPNKYTSSYFSRSLTLKAKNVEVCPSLLKTTSIKNSIEEFSYINCGIFSFSCILVGSGLTKERTITSSSRRLKIVIFIEFIVNILLENKQSNIKFTLFQG